MINEKVSLSQIVKERHCVTISESGYNIYGTDPNNIEEILIEHILYNENMTIAKNQSC